MNCYLVVFATIVVAVNARAGRQGGWGQPTTTTTTVPPTTSGWPSTTAPPPPGWPAPSSPGWAAPAASNVTVAIEGDLAAAGSGWAGSSQSAELLALQNTPDSEDPSQVSQSGVISQTTGINPLSAVGVQTIDVNQLAIGAQGIDASAIGGNYAQAVISGWSAAAGDAESSANGNVDILVNKPAVAGGWLP